MITFRRYTTAKFVHSTNSVKKYSYSWLHPQTESTGWATWVTASEQTGITVRSICRNGLILCSRCICGMLNAGWKHGKTNNVPNYIFPILQFKLFIKQMFVLLNYLSHILGEQKSDHHPWNPNSGTYRRWIIIVRPCTRRSTRKWHKTWWRVGIHRRQYCWKHSSICHAADIDRRIAIAKIQSLVVTQPSYS